MRKKITLFIALFSVSYMAVAQCSVTAATTNVSCNGGANGSAILSLTGFTGNATYAWTPAVSTGASATGLAAGTYSVTVSENIVGTTLFSDDFNGPLKWVLNTAASANNGAQPNIWKINNVSPYSGSCNGPGGGNTMHVGCQGGFMCSGYGEGAFYDETGTSHASDQFTQTINNINTTGYTGITVSFAYQCRGQVGVDYATLRYSTDGGTTWVDMPTQYAGNTSAWQCATVALPATCNNISTLKIGFRWRNNGNNVGSDPAMNIENLVVSGDDGTLPTGCTATTTFTITQPAAFVITTDAPLNPGVCTGDTLILNATNLSGCAPIIVTSPGTYTFHCTDTNGCAASSAAIVVNPGSPSNSLVVTANVTDVTTIGGNDGTAAIHVSGCPGPYSYTWTPNVTTADSTGGLLLGHYTVGVTSPGYIISNIFTDDFESGSGNWVLNTPSGSNGVQPNPWIINNSSPYMGNCDPNAANNTMHVSCDGGFLCPFYGDGAFYDETATTHATDLFTSTINSINTTGYSNVKVSFTYQSKGQVGHDYATLRYSTDNGGTWTDMPTQYASTGSAWHCETISLPASCNNISTLKIGFRWKNGGNNIGFDPPMNIDNVRVTAESGSGCGCYGSVNFDVYDPTGIILILNVDSTNSQQASNNGTLTVTATGGTAPYQYRVSGHNTWQTSNVFTGLAPGTYGVTVMDANHYVADAIGIVGENTVGINENSLLTAFDIFPNPAQNQVTLQLATAKPFGGTVKIVTPLGQVVREEAVSFTASFNKVYSVGSLANGIYSIVISANSKTFARRLVVNN